MKNILFKLLFLFISFILISCTPNSNSSADIFESENQKVNEIVAALDNGIFPKDYYLKDGTSLPSKYTVTHNRKKYDFDITWSFPEKFNSKVITEYVRILSNNKVKYKKPIHSDLKVLLNAEAINSTGNIQTSSVFEYRLFPTDYGTDENFEKYYNAIFKNTGEEIEIEGYVSAVNINTNSPDYGNMFIIDKNYNHGYFIYFPLGYEENQHKEFVENYKIGREVYVKGKPYLHKGHAEIKYSTRVIENYEYTDISFNKEKFYKNATAFFENAKNTRIDTFFEYQNVPVIIDNCKYIRQDNDFVYFKVGNSQVEYRFYKADYFVKKDRINEMIAGLNENTTFSIKGMVSYYNDLELLLTDEYSISIPPSNSVMNIMNQTLDNIYSYYKSNYIFKELKNYNTDELNNIIIELLENHIFTSKDSINNLIELLEELKKEY